jgi:hypothetical protein
MKTLKDLPEDYEVIEDEIEYPNDCQSCAENNYLDSFGHQTECSHCSLWHKPHLTPLNLESIQG